MKVLIITSLIISLILTLGVYLTGHIDPRQMDKYGFTRSRILILSYTFIYSLINSMILLNIYSLFIALDTTGFFTLLFTVFVILVYIGIVHTDTENSLIEYFFDRICFYYDRLYKSK